MPLQSGFLNVGTSGKTVDGRTIESSWLEEAVESYDPELYTAVIDLNHWDSRWAGTFGKVLAIKMGKNKTGEPTLLANIEPNEALIAMSKKEVLFTSVSLLPDFRETGKHYLDGLAVTPKPASVGTTQLIFASKTGNDKAVSTDFIPIELSFTDSKHAAVDDEKLFSRLIKRMFSHDDAADPNEQDTTMSTAALEKRFDTLEEKMTTFFANHDKATPDAPTAETIAAAEKVLKDNGYSLKKEPSTDDLNAAQALLKAKGFAVEKEASKEDIDAAQALLKGKGFAVSKATAPDNTQDNAIDPDKGTTISRSEFEVLQAKFADAKVTEFNFTASSDNAGSQGDDEFL